MLLVKFLLATVIAGLINADPYGVGKCVLDPSEYMTKCRDHINNVIIFQDCAPPNSNYPLSFTNIEIELYDAIGKPLCCTTLWNKPAHGYVQLPGKMRIRKGTITINRDWLSNNTPLGIWQDYFLVSATQTGIFGTVQFCDKGRSTFPFIPDGVCYQNLCEGMTSRTCDALDRDGVANLPDDLEDGFQDMFDIPDFGIFDSFLKGNYSVKFEVNHSGTINTINVIGCIENTELWATTAKVQK